MSTGFVAALGLTVAIIFGARLFLSGPPFRGSAVTLTWEDVGLTLLGLAGLAFHCGAMFFRTVVEQIPGTGGAIRDIRALGVASLAWYVVPALLVAVGLHRLPWEALSAVVLALLAIGVTMYDEGPLRTHLASIFVAVVLVSVVVALLARPPRPGTRVER